MANIFDLLGIPGDLETFQTDAMRTRGAQVPLSLPERPKTVNIPISGAKIGETVPVERPDVKEQFDRIYRGIVPPELQTGFQRSVFPYSFTTEEMGRAGPAQMGSMVASSVPGVGLVTRAAAPFIRGAGNFISRKLSELDDPEADITAEDIIGQFNTLIGE